MDVNSDGIVTSIAKSLGAGEASIRLLVSLFAESVARDLGADEPSIRLIVSLFAGYPLAFLYRSVIHGSQPTVQHVYFTACGIGLCYFNFGADTLHSVINICAIWCLLKVLGGTAISVALAFLFNTFYLVCGYYNVISDDYDISWATPHCVLCLRLTGVVFDYYDGSKKEENLSGDQKRTVLHKKPSLLELLGHTYFFGGFLVGPQFDMKRYQMFVEGKYLESQYGIPPLNVSLSLGRMCMGILYIAAFQIMCSFFFKYTFMLTDDFKDLNFLLKCAYILLWGKFTICKYVGCWLVAEGSCILSGLTYNGKDINGNTLWNGCTNVKIWQLESSSTFREMIAGFNVNTNSWMVQYVMKRLKFLGSKQLSQGATLLYLSVWHGLHSGYYMNFFLEFIMLNGETRTRDVLSRFPSIHHISTRPVLKPLVWIVKKTFMQFFVSYALISFVHLKFHRYNQVYSSVYYIGHVIFLVLPVIYYFIKSSTKRTAKVEANGHTRVSNGSVISNGTATKEKVN